MNIASRPDKPIVERISDAISQYFQQSGGSALEGRLFALHLFASMPLSLTELSQRLRVCMCGPWNEAGCA